MVYKTAREGPKPDPVKEHPVAEMIGTFLGAITVVAVALSLFCQNDSIRHDICGWRPTSRLGLINYYATWPTHRLACWLTEEIDRKESR